MTMELDRRRTSQLRYAEGPLLFLPRTPIPRLDETVSYGHRRIRFRPWHGYQSRI
jgi:hypothetical protein